MSTVPNIIHPVITTATYKTANTSTILNNELRLPTIERPSVTRSPLLTPLDLVRPRLIQAHSSMLFDVGNV